MRADVVRVTPPNIVHGLSMRELSEVMGPENPEYPSSVTVTCDGCDALIRVEVIVRDETAGHMRLAMARIYATTKGWTTDENGDLCPRHTEGTS